MSSPPSAANLLASSTELPRAARDSWRYVWRALCSGVYGLGYGIPMRRIKRHRLSEKLIPSESFPEITLNRMALEFSEIAAEYSRIVSSVLVN